jgi:hypothetical protein
MGLAYDANQVLKIPNIKQEMLSTMKNSEENNESENVKKITKKRKLHVVQSLEEEAKYPRAKLFRLPNNEVQFATYMIDKYGENYQVILLKILFYIYLQEKIDQ